MDTHSQRHQTESRNRRKAISFQQIAFSAPAMAWFCLFVQCACVPKKNNKPCVQSLLLSSHMSAVWVHVSNHVCVCVCLFVTLIGTQQCKHPFLPILLNIALMPRDDKLFCGASWRQKVGGCSSQCFGGDKGHRCSRCPPEERHWLGLNSGLTYLSAPEIPGQTCRVRLTWTDTH